MCWPSLKNKYNSIYTYNLQRKQFMLHTQDIVVVFNLFHRFLRHDVTICKNYKNYITKKVKKKEAISIWVWSCHVRRWVEFICIPFLFGFEFWEWRRGVQKMVTWETRGGRNSTPHPRARHGLSGVKIMMPLSVSDRTKGGAAPFVFGPAQLWS